MDTQKLQEILKSHAVWVNGNGGGSRANRRGADLRDAYLIGANLSGANLRDANLSGANLDFSEWPLWCGSASVKIDERIARQLLAHAFSVAREFCPPTIEQVEFCNQFHRIVSREFPKL